MGCKEELIGKILESAGGRELGAAKLDMIRRIVRDDTSILDMNKIANRIFEASTIDKIQEAWMAGILSSPTTQVANMIGNTVAFANRFPEKIVSVGVDLIRSTVKGIPRERFFGEVFNEATYGVWAGVKDGTRRAIFSIKNELPSAALVKLDLRRSQSIPGLTGDIIRTPFRLLTATDEFFRALNYNTEIHALAYRIAAQSGKRGRARVNEMAKLISTPTEAMIIKAASMAKDNIFQKELGSLGRGFQKLRNDPVGRYFLPFIIPFVRTPINLAKFGLKRTPVNLPVLFGKIIRSKALLTKQAKGIKLTVRERKAIIESGDISDELAKTVMGSFIGATAMAYTKEGLITGQGPTDPSRRRAWERTHQPYSIKIGDKWVSYARLEPMTIPLGLAADWAEIDEFIEDGALSSEAIGAIVGAISKNITNKTFMQGLSRAFNALSDWDRYGEDFTAGLLGSLVPAGVANIAGAIDPVIRKREGLVDALQSRIGAGNILPIGEELIPRRDLWGNALKKTELSPILAAISPIRVKSSLVDKVEEEMSRLGVFSGPPNVKELRGMEITPRELDQYIVEAGQLAKKLLDDIVQGRGYSLVSDIEKKIIIEKTIFYTRRAAGANLLTTKLLELEKSR